MDVTLHYGESELSLTLPAGARVDTFAPASARSPVNSEKFVRAVDDYRDVFEGEPPLFVINDGYRSTPTASVLSYLDQAFPSVLDNAEYLIATGTHQPPTDEHYHTILGHLHDRLIERVSFHSAREPEQMRRVGRDSLGGDVYLNRTLLEARRVVIVGSVEPHYFAGFTGGRKAIFPGLTDLATVERNHNLANSLAAAPLKIDGNPVAEHLEELMSFVPNELDVLSLQVVCDADGALAGVFCGPLGESLRGAAALAEDIFAHKVSRSYDVVFCELIPPLDRNLYQAQKALENCQAAVADGGTIVIVSACAEGVGSKHFFELAERWDAANNRSIDGKQRFGSHKLSRVIEIGRRINVRLYSTLDPAVPQAVFYEPLDNLSDFSFTEKNESETVAVAIVHDAGNTVLHI